MSILSELLGGSPFIGHSPKNYTVNLNLAGHSTEDVNIEYNELSRILSISSDKSNGFVSPFKYTYKISSVVEAEVESAVLKDGLLVVKFREKENLEHVKKIDIKSSFD